MNSVHLTGRLTRDPKLIECNEFLPEEIMCDIPLAVDGLGANSEVSYIDVECRGKAGVKAARLLSEGYLVSVSGRLVHRTWTGGDGVKHDDYRVVGDVEVLAGPPVIRSERDWRAGFAGNDGGSY